MDPDTDLLGSDEFDRFDMDDTPETDLFSEKHDDIGVGSRFGDEEVEVSGTAMANSSSAGMAGKGRHSVDVGVGVDSTAAVEDVLRKAAAEESECRQRGCITEHRGWNKGAVQTVKQLLCWCEIGRTFSKK